MKSIIIVLSVLIIAVSIIIFWPKPKFESMKPLINQPAISEKAQIWTLTAVGDIQLSRQVATKINQNGVDFPFDKIRDTINGSDIVIGNLESPLTLNKAVTDPTTMIFGAETKTVEGLKNAGFNLLNLANNHFSNQGRDGMDLTFKTLVDNSIDYFGAGINFNSAHKPFIKKIGDIEIAFLGYTDKDVLPTNSIPKSDTPGVSVIDVIQAKVDITQAKIEADMVIVSMHSGTEYTPNPNQKQIDFAHAAIDNGADLVLGHHPHVVQAIEDYKGKKIFYSLGNFIFDQAWSKETQEGLMVKLTFANTSITNTELKPIKIDNWCQPRLLEATEPAYNNILDRITTASNKFK
jgi:poly-gamma-glutamate capsule biosynthesis protein CapA/YwtB (metallophosphatase superfamily)